MKHIILSIFLISEVNAQQPPKWQAIYECNQVKELAQQISELKNLGATKANIHSLKSMSTDGRGILGDLALVLYDKHIKGKNSKGFSSSMYQQCMHSNGF